MYHKLLFPILTLFIMTGCQQSVSNVSEVSVEEAKEIEKTLPSRVLEDSAKKYTALGTELHTAQGAY